MKKQLKRKCLATLLTILMIFGLLPAGLFAAEGDDLAGYWAETHIRSWLDRGLAAGYPDGTFRPNHQVSRAEFITFTNRAFKIPEAPGNLRFTDVLEGVWFYTEISKAVKAEMVTGYPDGTFRPQKTITRQEAAVLLARLLDLPAAQGLVFEDHDRIGAWANSAVDTVSAIGVMTGYPDGTFKPQQPITRAESVVMLDRAFALADYVVVEPDMPEVFRTQFDYPGTYGPETGMQTKAGDIIINSDGVVLRNILITGNLIISKEVGEGNVTLDNVIVQGDTYLRGGGMESIYITGGRYEDIIVEKTSGGLRIVAVDAQGLRVIIAEASEGIEVILEGNFESVTVYAPDVTLTLQGVGSSVNILNIEAVNTTVQGEGSITTANIEAKGAEIKQTPEAITLGEGITATVGGEEVQEEPDPDPVSESFPTRTVSMEPLPDLFLALGEEQALHIDTNATSLSARSDDESVAAVSVDGLTLVLEARGEGTAEITVTATRSGYSSRTRTFTVESISFPFAEGDFAVYQLNLGLEGQRLHDSLYQWEVISVSSIGVILEEISQLLTTIPDDIGTLPDAFLDFDEDDEVLDEALYYSRWGIKDRLNKGYAFEEDGDYVDADEMASMLWLPDAIAEGEDVIIADLILTAQGPVEINLPGLSGVQAWTFQAEEDDVVFTLHYDTDLGLLLAFRLEDRKEDREGLLIELTLTGSNLAFQSYPGESDSKLVVASQDVSSSQINEHLGSRANTGGFTIQNELAPDTESDFTYYEETGLCTFALAGTGCDLQTAFYDEGENNEAGEFKVGTLGFLPNSCGCYLGLELEAPYLGCGIGYDRVELGGLPGLVGMGMAAFDRNLVMPHEEGNTIKLDIFGRVLLGASARSERSGYYSERIYVCGEEDETGRYTISFHVDPHVDASLESSESIRTDLAEAGVGIFKELPRTFRGVLKLIPKGVNHGRIGVLAQARVYEWPYQDQVKAEKALWIIEAPTWRPQAGMWWNWSSSNKDAFQITLEADLEAGKEYTLHFDVKTLVFLHAYGLPYMMEGTVKGDVKLQNISIHGPAIDPPLVRSGLVFNPEEDCPKLPTALQIDPIGEQLIDEPFGVMVNLVDDEGNPAAVRCSCITDTIELHVETGTGNLICEASGSTPALSLIAGENSLIFENVIYDRAEEGIVIKVVGTGRYSELELGLSNAFDVKEQEDDDGNGNGENGELSKRDYRYLNPPTSDQLGNRDFKVKVEQDGNGLLVSVNPTSWPSDEDPYERVIYELIHWYGSPSEWTEYKEGYRYIVYIGLERWSPVLERWAYCQGSADYGRPTHYPWGFAYGWVDMYIPRYLWYSSSYLGNHYRSGPGYRRVRLSIWEIRAWDDGGIYVIDGGRGYSNVFWWEFDDDNKHLHFEWL